MLLASSHSWAHPLNRKFPSVGCADTLMFKVGEVPKSLYGDGHIFIPDNEVKKVHPADKTIVVEGIEIGVIEDTGVMSKRHILQQQGMRGCTTAATAMLILDHGLKPDWYEVRTSNLGNGASKVMELEAAGLLPLPKIIAASEKSFKSRTSSKISAWLEAGNREEAYKMLSTELAKNGPAILSVGGEIGGHVVVIDSLSFAEDRATIRDPYHGWAIDISLQSLMSRAGFPIEFIQAEKRVPPPAPAPKSLWRRILRR